MLLLKLFVSLVLVLVFAEDMRSRSVHWYWFPLLLIGLLALRYVQIQGSLGQLFAPIACSGGFLLIQLLLLTLYFSIKHQKFTNITEGLLGWGDVLLLFCIGAYLPLLYFLIFYVGSLVVILLGWAIYQQLHQQNQTAIPLAGLQALILLLFLACSWVVPQLNLRTDDELIIIWSRWM